MDKKGVYRRDEKIQELAYLGQVLVAENATWLDRNHT
jgi:hypothetical protein